MAWPVTVSGVPDMPERELTLVTGGLYVVGERITVFELPPGDDEKVFRSNQTYYGVPGSRAVVLDEGTLVTCIGPRLVDACWIIDVAGTWMLSDGTGLKHIEDAEEDE